MKFIDRFKILIHMDEKKELLLTEQYLEKLLERHLGGRVNIIFLPNEIRIIQEKEKRHLELLVIKYQTGEPMEVLFNFLISSFIKDNYEKKPN